MVNEFTKETIEYLNTADIKYRKSKGQYFTPKSIRKHLLEQLPKTLKKPKVLDPSCGTGEFLLSAKEYFNQPSLYGWDIDEKLTRISKKIAPRAKIKTLDALNQPFKGAYDVIIGNPPYYEFKLSQDIRQKYGDVIGGRANIFSLFIKLGLELLREGGYLAYVLPPSMNNGAYFSNLRDYIIRNADIKYLKILNDTSLFHKALQMTMLLVLRKGKNTGRYIFKKNGIQIFSENAGYLKKAFKNKACLYDIGYKVYTGRLVWNQNKEFLTNDASRGIPLIWAHNITESGLKMPVENKKPQYVKVKSYDVGPAIAVNRITGAARSAKLKAAIIPKHMKFIAENHCNVIFPPTERGEKEKELFKSKTKHNYSIENILNQLKSREKLKVMQNITGNTQISKTELERLFPIDI